MRFVGTISGGDFHGVRSRAPFAATRDPQLKSISQHEGLL